MADRVNEVLFTKVARKTGNNTTLVRKVVTSQFQYVHKTMKLKEMPAIKLDYLGKFHVKPNRKKYLDGLKAKSKDND